MAEINRNNPALRAMHGISNFIMPSAEASPAVAEAAREYIGQGEQGANNAGPFVKSLGGEIGDPWCANFVSRVTRDVGEDVWGQLPRAKSWYENAQKAGYTVDTPQVGDIVVWGRAGGGHVGIVDSINGDAITTIEGNVGSYPASVRRFGYSMKDMNTKGRTLIGYVRTPARRK